MFKIKIKKKNLYPLGAYGVGVLGLVLLFVGVETLGIVLIILAYLARIIK